MKLIGVHTDSETFKRRLLEGEGAGPPEDCGGLPGYERLVHFVETGEDSDNDPETLAEWLNGWHPDAFDFDSAQASFDQ